MCDYGKLCDLAQYEIEDLQAAGITPSPAEIVDLNALAWSVRSTANRMQQSKGAPVRVGGVTLWPLTMQSGAWYRDEGCNIKGLEHEALAYAMAHGYAAGEPFLMDDPATTVKAWSATIKATAGAMTAALDAVLVQMEHPDMPPKPDGKGLSHGELSAMLAAATGIEPDYWERRCSMPYAVRMLHIAAQQRNESGKQLASDPVVQATIALGWAVEKIRRRHKGE